MLQRRVNGLTNLWKYGLDDRTLTQLTFGGGADTSPMPDPAGKGIYFVSGTTSAVLAQYQVKTGTTAEIVSDEVSQPSVSPDGTQVMYIRWPERGKSELWVASLRDPSQKLRLATGGNVATGDWSPDGSQVLFMVRSGKESQNFIVGADGRGLQEIKGPPTGILWGTWAVDGRSVFLTSGSARNFVVWRSDLERASVEQVEDHGSLVAAASPDGRYLLGFSTGDQGGIYQLSVREKRWTKLLPGIETYGLRFAPDFRSIVYAVAGRGAVTFYRQGWRDGVLVGKPQVALTLPFAFPLAYGGNAFDFSRDLSTIVYARPVGHADLYLLGIGDRGGGQALATFSSRSATPCVRAMKPETNKERRR